MLKVLIRVVVFVVSLGLLVDVLLPVRTEALTVDLHSSHEDTRPHRFDTSYTLQFAGGTTGSCSVGFTAYSSLKDGDPVDVQASKLFKHCVAISKDGRTVESDKYWRLWHVIIAAFLMAVALGWIDLDTEGQSDGP
jgi:hypothetical protein